VGADEVCILRQISKGLCFTQILSFPGPPKEKTMKKTWALSLLVLAAVVGCVLAADGCRGGGGDYGGCDYREFRPYVNQHPYATRIADLVDHTGFVVGKHIGV
jgi:hypothetical protein